MGKDSMWFFQKLTLGLALVNGILMALADKKLTLEEIVGIVNSILAGFADDLKISIDDLNIELTDDEAVIITLEPDLAKKLAITL